MKKTFFIVLTLFLLTSCCSDADFVFTNRHRAFLNKYSVADTVYFINSANDLDTFFIAKVDSFQECGIIMAGKRKNISIEIKHLPNNKWTDGTESTQDNKSKILNQSLITIEKMINRNPEDQYSIGLSYRDFRGEIENINQIQNDNLLAEFGVDKYWLINTVIPNDKLDSTSVKKVLWTEKFGLTAYYKNNGDIYKLKRK